MNDYEKLTAPRYGVDIIGPSGHEEANELIQVYAALEGCAGNVRVFDRFRKSFIFSGTVDEVRDSIRAMVLCRQDRAQDDFQASQTMRA